MRGATWRHDGNRGAVQCFNPRAPCGARPLTASVVRSHSLFQSTRPMRGATSDGEREYEHQAVSIHAPHAGRDASLMPAVCMFSSFNPRAPCGARPAAVLPSCVPAQFQSTRPMRGATFQDGLGWMAEQFQSTRPMRGATCLAVCLFPRCIVSIHAPHAGRDGRCLRSHHF